MGVLIFLLFAIAVSLLVVRIGAIALQMTGLSADVASFQAQSAFSGVGYTTSEAESIMTHPVRRRICRLLMLLGTVGFTSVVATVIMTIMASTAENWYYRLGGAIVGVLSLFLIAKMPFVNVVLTVVIRWALKKWTRLEVKDYEQILHVARGYSISQILVEPGEWLADKTLRQLALTSEGVIVLSIMRKDGTVLGTPGPDTTIRQGDKLICYGREENLANLAERQIGRMGDLQHQEMAIAHERSQTAETILDTEGGPDEPEGQEDL